MPEPKVSVIVPMYRAARYLTKCVDSIRAQTLRDIEIILVDDASPDRFGEMADAWAQEDPRIRVVHHEVNRGLSATRNTGLDVACGRYVAFVDADDWASPKMYEALISAAERTRADAVFSGLLRMHQGEVVVEQRHPLAPSVLRGQDEIFRLRREFYGPAPACELAVPGFVWTGLYEREFLEKRHIRFEEAYAEDRIFNTMVCRTAEIVTCCEGTWYRYRRDGQISLTNSFGDRTANSISGYCSRLLDMASDEPDGFRNECIVRAKRYIIDLIRGHIGIVSSAQIGRSERLRLASRLLSVPALRKACQDYPFWRMPLDKALFFLSERFQMPRIALRLAYANVALRSLRGC